MPCERVLIGGSEAIVCSRGRRQRPKRCGWCRRESTRLCDWPMDYSGRTCDKPVCDEHAHSVGEDRDLCPAHAPLADEWKGQPA